MKIKVIDINGDGKKWKSHDPEGQKVIEEARKKAQYDFLKKYYPHLVSVDRKNEPPWDLNEVGEKQYKLFDEKELEK